MMAPCCSTAPTKKLTSVYSSDGTCPLDISKVGAKCSAGARGSRSSWPRRLARPPSSRRVLCPLQASHGPPRPRCARPAVVFFLPLSPRGNSAAGVADVRSCVRAREHALLRPAVSRARPHAGAANGQHVAQNGQPQFHHKGILFTEDSRLRESSTRVGGTECSCPVCASR